MNVQNTCRSPLCGSNCDKNRLVHMVSASWITLRSRRVSGERTDCGAVSVREQSAMSLVSWSAYCCSCGACQYVLQEDQQAARSPANCQRMGAVIMLIKTQNTKLLIQYDRGKSKTNKWLCKCTLHWQNNTYSVQHTKIFWIYHNIMYVTEYVLIQLI